MPSPEEVEREAGLCRPSKFKRGSAACLMVGMKVMRPRSYYVRLRRHERRKPLDDRPLLLANVAVLTVQTQDIVSFDTKARGSRGLFLAADVAKSYGICIRVFSVGYRNEQDWNTVLALRDNQTPYTERLVIRVRRDNNHWP